MRENISYLVFKLSCNSSGVKRTKIQEMFGRLGTDKLNALVNKGLIKRDGEVFKSAIEGFSLGHETFVDHFKAVAGGVEMTDIVTYVLPFGILGRLVHPFLVRPKLEQIFSYRFQKVDAIFK